LVEGDLERAEALFRQARADVAELNPESVHAAWYADGLGESLRRRGATDEAEPFFEEALRIYWKLGSRGGIAGCLEGLASIASFRREDDRVGRLIGAAESLRKEWHVSPARRERIPLAVPDGARAKGATMSLDEAVTYALSHLD
jgi:tetratricopeptide (TPR) repeat protein